VGMRLNRQRIVTSLMAGAVGLAVLLGTAGIGVAKPKKLKTSCTCTCVASIPWASGMKEQTTDRRDWSDERREQHHEHTA
jgi:hypothetical protein